MFSKVLGRWNMQCLVFLVLQFFDVGHSRNYDGTINSTSTSTDTSTITTITLQDIARSAVAMQLSTIIEGHRKDADELAASYGHNPNNGIYLESRNKIDAVYVAKVDSVVGNTNTNTTYTYCTASFRGTSFTQVSDWFVNLDFDPVTMRMPSMANATDTDTDTNDAMCEVHGGYHDAYVNFDYRDRVETFLHNCHNQCRRNNNNNKECETLLIGHSQGGGIAEISALYYLQQQQQRQQQQERDTEEELIDEMIKPYVITFGGVPALGAGCKQSAYLADEQRRRRWFRYILTNEGPLLGGKKLLYDPIPILFSQLLDPPPEDDDVDTTDTDTTNSNSNNNILDTIFDGKVTFFNKLPAATLDSSYARFGGLAFIGHEIVLSVEDPTVMYLTGFDHHRYVDLAYIDPTGMAHHTDPYYYTLQAQKEFYNTNNNKNTNTNEFIRIQSDGFGKGSLCNPDEEVSSSSSLSLQTTTCAKGLSCVVEEEIGASWWSSFSFWEKNPTYICQQQQQQQGTQQQQQSLTTTTATTIRPSVSPSTIPTGRTTIEPPPLPSTPLTTTTAVTITPSSSYNTNNDAPRGRKNSNDNISDNDDSSDAAAVDLSTTTTVAAATASSPSSTTILLSSSASSSSFSCSTILLAQNRAGWMMLLLLLSTAYLLHCWY